MSSVPPGLAEALSDRYRIERELGAGGMATVHLAGDLRHDRKVAIKVLKPELAVVLGGERFLLEIKTTAALSHPHILPLFDSGEAAGFLYYVMPYLEGETIRERLDRETQLGVEEAVRIATEVADALDYAHRHGVIHRDIKPENVLLHDGRAMVMDFGIALAVSAAAGGRLTETGISLGTPHYMSPEQATADKAITVRSDVYSLACVLYEMLAGEPPHLGGSAQQIVMKIVTEAAAPLARLRKTVPPNVAAAVARALEKLPADRFASARAFADALQDPHFASPRSTTAGDGSTSRRAWLRDPRSLSTLAVAAVALALLVGTVLRPAGPGGPVEYDVGLPDTAAMWTASLGVGFAVAPGGDFVVYETAPRGRTELWYRSLLDGTVRRIPGTDDGSEPAVSRDGTRVAFLRTDGDGWTVETLPIEGGTATTFGRGTGPASLQWLTDGRLQVVDDDGNRARWFDPDGGPTRAASIAYCIGEALVPGEDAFLCGGGARKLAYRTELGDSTSRRPLWRASPDTLPVFGSHFRVVDGRYLVYLSNTGDLLAAPVDFETGGVGRAVRMAAGVGLREYSATGSYAIAASGTLVYAQGSNQALGYLVAAGGPGLDTLPLGRDAFITYDFSPDGRRLAAVVEGLEGMELRIYDLASGRHLMWVRRPQINHPAWSPRGDRLVFGGGDSVFVGSPDRSGPPEFLVRAAGDFEAYTWMADDRIIGALLGPNAAAALRIDRRPVTIDTLIADVGFVRPSPDGRWIAYTNTALTELWLEPFPGDGRRFQVAAGNIGEPQWLSPSELAMSMFDGTRGWVERVQVRAGQTPPLGSRRHWAELPDFRETFGPSIAVAPGDRIVYLEGSLASPVHYLRVVPHWVERMKRTVDGVNR